MNRNNQDWMEKIYVRYKQQLFLYALSLTKSKEKAEDLTSETIVRAILSYDYKNPNIEFWLFRVLKNLYIDTVRKDKFLIDTNKYNVDWVQDPYDATATYIKNEQTRWLYSKIYELAQRERDIMLLSLTSNLSDNEIACHFELEVNTMRMIRYRVKEKLKQIAKKEKLL
ncbi:RNA polymerase sigma-70 factor (ECF subfamily) [Breznakia blatticola]|uniref:RNA polymerase sigma-70 factor (ECF subfamily) n=1 Tax=Breznakia blatticola TaxID=1754012 RepID=A0A4R7Z849_9FIRM|nr:sigma-70 family RNA polymerase sigma factor [Breznakia blatticola]TDW08049.1 RNA polymerase sigma-70 factor (ECF subfamily) [Breznakia blatticola]